MRVLPTTKARMQSSISMRHARRSCRELCRRIFRATHAAQLSTSSGLVTFPKARRLILVIHAVFAFTSLQRLAPCNRALCGAGFAPCIN